MAMRTKGWLLATAGAAAFGVTALTADRAVAAFDSVASGTGNVCTGVLGTFPDCNVSSEVEGADSPLIAKYEFDDNQESSTAGTFVFEGAGTIFSDEIDGGEFSFSDFDTDDPKEGVWNYSPDLGQDPFVTHYALKFGDNWEIYSWTGVGTGGFSDNWDLSKGLSNITFYDTGVVPLPAAAWMMIGGLGVIGGAMKWRRRAGAADA